MASNTNTLSLALNLHHDHHYQHQHQLHCFQQLRGGGKKEREEEMAKGCLAQKKLEIKFLLRGLYKIDITVIKYRTYVPRLSKKNSRSYHLSLASTFFVFVFNNIKSVCTNHTYTKEKEYTSYHTIINNTHTHTSIGFAVYLVLIFVDCIPALPSLTANLAEWRSINRFNNKK